MSELKVQNLRRTFGSVVALEDMSFDVHEGEFFCLLGPSSSGKTTTLRSIAGLEQLDKGKVHFAGQNVTNAPVQGRGMSMIFQTFALYPHLSVEANFAHPLRRSGVSSSGVKKRKDTLRLAVAHTGGLKPYAIKNVVLRSTSPYWTRVRSAIVEFVGLVTSPSELSTRAPFSIVSRPTNWRRLDTTSRNQAISPL